MLFGAFYLISGKIPALNKVWILGDVHLAMAVEDFRRFGTSTESYIANKYDIHILYTPRIVSSNNLARIMNALMNQINGNMHLPKAIIVFLGGDFEAITGSHKSTDATVGWLFGSIITAIEDRKATLLDNAYRKTEPKIIMIKPTPKFVCLDGKDEHKNLHRVFNRSTESVLAHYDFTYIFNVDGV